MEIRAVNWLRQEQSYDGPYRISHSAELRYRGQSFEIDTPVEANALDDWQAIADAFHGEHERVYGHADRSATIQAISLRVVITGEVAKPAFPRFELEPGVATPVAHVEAWMDGARHRTAIYRRAELKAGRTFAGPAIVAQDDCTTVVPPGMSVRVDEYANLRIATAGVA